VAFGATAAMASPRAALLDQAAPPFEFQRFVGTIQVVPGRTLALERIQGRPVVLNFWSSWCDDCRREGALLEQLWREYRERGVVFVGLAVHDTDHNGQAFVRRTPITFPAGLDAFSAISSQYQIAGLPETLFLAPDHRIIRRHAGPLTEAAARAYLDELVQVSAVTASARSSG
jgi:cytochrome c biogenesis protein CcmG/thiol:disulfide interchange protein DsbE